MNNGINQGDQHRMIGQQQAGVGAMNRVCQVRHLGLVSYQDGLNMQAALVASRKAHEVEDTLLLLEHSPTITMGRGANSADILIGPEELAALGVGLYQTNRGGHVTYHGPGQLVAYPIFDLNPDRRDAHQYLRDLEEVIIRSLADLGIQAHRIPGLTGVWVGRDKIAAIGVHLSGWVTSHGLALNVKADLETFNFIIPCGLPRDSYGVTSIQTILQTSVDMPDISQRLVHHFCQIFQREALSVPPDQDSVQVIVMAGSDPQPEFLLLRRTPDRGGFWQPITGVIEIGETPVEAASRELKEETGLAGKPVSLDLIQSFLIDPRLSKRGGRPLLFNREHSFVFKTAKHPIRMNPDEHIAAQWVTLQSALALVKWDSTRQGLIRATHCRLTD